MLAVQRKSVEATVVLLQNGADPYVSNNTGECAASAALRTMKDKGELVSNIAKLAGNKVDQRGDGLLHYAAQIADQDDVQALLALGLDKSRRNSSGETPRDVALRWQKGDVARALQ
jgi:ankyrin repeat protein